MNEITFNSLKNSFNEVCDQVNNEGNAVTLTLKNNRKVYIMPEESYDKVEHILVTKISSTSLAFHC